MPKSLPKCIQTCFRVIFSKKNLCPVFHGGSSFRKFQFFFFKIPKMPKIVPKSIQTCFECVLRQTFRKNFAQFSTAGRILENFQINQKKNSKIQKRPKSFPKESKRVLIVIWDNFSEKFLPSFPWKVESSKFFKKIKNFQNSKNAQNRSQKYPNVF